MRNIVLSIVGLRMLYKVNTTSNVTTSPHSKEAHATTTQNEIRTEFVNKTGVSVENPEGIGVYWTSYMDSRVSHTAAAMQNNPKNTANETRNSPNFLNIFGCLIARGIFAPHEKATWMILGTRNPARKKMNAQDMKTIEPRVALDVKRN